MSNQNLYLIGTVHHDLDGKERLDTLLNRLSPSIVALEFHKDRESFCDVSNILEYEKKSEMIINESGLNFNTEQKKTLFESGRRINNVVGYEYLSSKNYVDNNPDVMLEYIDISIYANGKEQFEKGYIEAASSNIKNLKNQPELLKTILDRLDSGIDNYIRCLREDVKQNYQNAETISEIYKVMCNPLTLKMAKDSMPAEAILALEQIYNPVRDVQMAQRVRELYDGVNRLVVIVGLGHLEGLKNRLARLKPHVLTLAEYDAI